MATQADSCEKDSDCKQINTQSQAEDRLKGPTVSDHGDQMEPNLTSGEKTELKNLKCKWNLPHSEAKLGCRENKMGGESGTNRKYETEDVFCAQLTGDAMTRDHRAGDVPCSLPPLSEITTPVSPNQNLTNCWECTGDLINSFDHHSNNMNNNNNNDDASNTSTKASMCADSLKDRPVNKILSTLFSSSSSKTPFSRSMVHRTASSLSSISEEEMLTMMESMGEDEILSSLPPCDCDECLLNEPRSPSIVPPDQRKLTRTSSWRKIRSFILWSPFIQVFKKHRYPWIQLAGHQGNFHAGEAGSVLKKLDSREQKCFQRLMADPLKDFVPEYRGNVEKNGEMYIQLQDLLASFSQPCVMDVKMGVRTYLEAELEKARKSPTLRKDMYQKMVEVDNTAPTQAEHEQRAVTKPRYMQWRDQMSSSTELGFRVEGIKKTDGSSTKDFKKTKSRGNIVDIILSFVANNETIAAKYVKRLKDIMATQESSDFFRTHEVVGSSLLFVHDAEENVGVWMIDFGKTEQLSGDKTLDHRSQWQEGNREDGYLFGLDNIISIFEEVQTNLSSSSV